MPTGNGISGLRGDALYHADGTQISEVKKFSWNPKQETKDYASNKTGGAKKRVSSVKDGSGSIDGVWDAWNPITDHMEPGTEVVLRLLHYTGQYWIVPAIIDDMSFECDIESGDVQSWTANFSLNGPWTKPVVLPATTTPAPTTAGLLGEFSQAAELSMPKRDQKAAGAAPPWGSPTGETPQGWPVHASQARAAAARPAPENAFPQPQQPQPQGVSGAHGPAMPGMDPDAIRALAAEVARILKGG